MREGGGSAVAYAWFVWQKGYVGTTEVRIVCSEFAPVAPTVRETAR